MYVARQFRVEPDEALRRAAEAGVGELVTHGENGLQATRLPFLVTDSSADGGSAAVTDADEGAGAITAETHVARVNPQWRDREALLVVTIADTHVAGTDMPPEPADSRYPRVPTWNYLTVHLRGELVAHDDADWKERHLLRFERRFEDEWRIESHSSLDLVRHALPAIVGLELRVHEVVGKAKLSQALPSDDLAHTIGSLRGRGTPDSGRIAGLMEEIAVPWVREREGRVDDARRTARRTDPEAQE